MLCLSLYLRNSDTSLNGHFDDAANGIVVTQTMGVVTRYFMDLKEINFFFYCHFLSLAQPLDSFWCNLAFFFFKFDSNVFTDYRAVFEYIFIWYHFEVDESNWVSLSISSSFAFCFPSPPFSLILQSYIFHSFGALQNQWGSALKNWWCGNLTRRGWIWTIDLPESL